MSSQLNYNPGLDPTVESDSHETKVIFRYDPETNEAIAIFPEVPGSSRYECSYYALVGQHSTCDPAYTMNITRPATEADYTLIKEELENLGYPLRVCERYTKGMLDARIEKFKVY